MQSDQSQAPQLYAAEFDPGGLTLTMFFTAPAHFDTDKCGDSTAFSVEYNDRLWDAASVTANDDTTVQVILEDNDAGTEDNDIAFNNDPDNIAISGLENGIAHTPTPGYPFVFA